METLIFLIDLKFQTDLHISKQTAAIFVIFCTFQRAKCICMIGRKGALSETEKLKIIERLHSKVPCK